jgi:hypothetical protein
VELTRKIVCAPKNKITRSTVSFTFVLQQLGYRKAQLAKSLEEFRGVISITYR